MNSSQQPPRPHTTAHFLVDLGAGDARGPEAGFCEVVFPDFRIDGGDRRLILRRGATGALDLYRWWDQARNERGAHPRSITVQLMTADLARAVMTWQFHGAHPVALSYAPLDALQPGVLMESIEVEFERVEMR